LQAAQLIAEGELTFDQIAKEVGFAAVTIKKRWNKHPEFRAKVAEIIADLAAKIHDYGLARKDRRVKAMDDRWKLLKQVIAERAATAEPDVPGDKTGLLVTEQKSIGGGEDAEKVKEYRVDAALLRELRELEKQASQEMGQWTEKQEHSGPGGKPVPVTIIEVIRPAQAALPPPAPETKG